MLAVVFLDSFDDSGLIKAFPSLPDDDLPTQPMDMHMTPDGSKWWIAGLEGQIVEVNQSVRLAGYPGTPMYGSNLFVTCKRAKVSCRYVGTHAEIYLHYE